MKIIEKLSLIKKVNKLEIENEKLKDTIKDQLYNSFMAKLNESLELERLRKENKKQRLKIKSLKEIIKEDK